MNDKCVTLEDLKAIMFAIIVLSFMAGFILHWIIYPHEKTDLPTFDFEKEKDDKG